VPLAVIHGPLHSSATADRLAGFLDRAALLGAAVEPDRVLTTADPDHLLIGYDAAARLLEAGTHPRGLFCSSDLIAFGAHRRLREAGVAVPGDVAVVGFDDNPLNPWVAPWLSSVKVPYEAFGQAIRATVDALMAGEPPARSILPHRFVDRWTEHTRHPRGR
jgi:LacI family transcriptional regulator